MKRLIALLIVSFTVSCFPSLPFVPADSAATAYAAVTVTSEDDDAAPTEEPTEEPASEEETPEPTQLPEDYTGTDNPEDSDEEMTMQGAGNDGTPGATGGLGFYGSKFPDCRGHWAEKIIVECTDKKYLDGYDDGTFRPDGYVTASEFAKIFSAWHGSFYQITNGFWAMPYIRAMLSDGVFEDGDYADYNVSMTREQVAKAVISSLKGEYFPSSLDRYREMITDIGDADAEYADYVIKAYISGIMTGYDDGTIKPKGKVTRAEILSIINRTINQDARIIPESVSSAAGDAPEVYTYYTAAVQVRKASSAGSMNYRLLGKNAQYMDGDDSASGLRMTEEFQGAQGFAFLMRFDISDILKRADTLKSISLIINHASGGDMDLGLFEYKETISQTDWNNQAYVQVTNNTAVAASDKAGYNAVVDNISALLPTWNNIAEAVPQEQKTQPFAQAELDNGQYVFELSIDKLKEMAGDDNIVEFFATTVNYDRYGVENDNKPKCYVAGSQAPQLYSVYDTGEPVSNTVTVTADTAELSGGMLNLFGTGSDAYIENFRQEQIITYNFKASQSGKYKMTIYYAANLNSGGGTAHFEVNGEAFDHEFAQTGSWTTYVYEDLGEVSLKAGNNKMVISDKEIPNTYLINIKTIVFEKTED